MKKIIESIIESSIEVKKGLLQKNVADIERAAQAIQKCIKGGGKLIIFGNGGSAADSQHIAAEFVGRFKIDRADLPALALTTNTSVLTSLSNDYGYEVTFKRQIECLGNRDDAALAISTSGNAKNVIEAVKTAKDRGMVVIGLTGKSGGALMPLCDISIVVGSEDTARIQEAHILLGHIFAEITESGR